MAANGQPTYIICMTSFLRESWVFTVPLYICKQQGCSAYSSLGLFVVVGNAVGGWNWLELVVLLVGG